MKGPPLFGLLDVQYMLGEMKVLTVKEEGKDMRRSSLCTVCRSKSVIYPTPKITNPTPTITEFNTTNRCPMSDVDIIIFFAFFAITVCYWFDISLCTTAYTPMKWMKQIRATIHFWSPLNFGGRFSLDTCYTRENVHKNIQLKLRTFWMATDSFFIVSFIAIKISKSQ